MVLRFLIRLLANNEQLVQKLSESYPMRRAAQIIVKAAFPGKFFLEGHNLQGRLSPEQFREAMRSISLRLQRQIQQAQEEIKRKMK